MIRAYVAQDTFNRSVRIALVHQSPEGRPEKAVRILDIDENGFATFQEDDVDPYATIRATLVLPEAEARALLDGLAAHFRGSSEMQALRADYEAERKRVDQLTQMLGDAVKAAAAREIGTPLYPAVISGRDT